MKKMKKFLCLFLAMVILIPNIAIFSSAAEQTDANEPLLIEVTTDKSSYTAYGIAEITVKVTNTSDEAVNNISAEAVFEQLAPVGKNNETFKEIETLESGESFTFSYKATLNANKVNINFFEKIILWFVRLFNGGYNATSHDIEADIENITEIKFGKYTVQNIVRVGYGETYGEKVEKAVENSTYVSTELEEIKNSEKYKSLSTEEKKKYIENKLNDLLNKGEIKSFSYSETSGLFSFEFSSGWRGGTVIEEKHDENCFSSTSSNININNDFYNVRDFSANALTYSKDTDNWLFIYGADENKSSYNYKHFTQLMNQYEDLGIDITLWDDVNEVTVSSYKNLDNYDLIYIMSHGNYYDTPYICTNEEATIEKKNNYSTELNNNDIEIFDGCFWIKPSFFENSYKDDLQDSLILMSCCKAFGENSHKDYSFAESFEKAGAGAVIGYCNTVANIYSNNFFEKIIYYITQNYSIGDAYDNSCDIIGQSEQEFYRNLGQNIAEEHPAYPVLYASNRNEKFIENSLEDKLGGFSAVIKDKSNNKPLEDVLVVICESNDSEKNLLCFFETDSNGSFFAELPNGKYNCLIHKNKYKDVEITFEINNCELVAYLEPIFIEPILTSANASVHGMVTDSETQQAISNVKVTLYSEDTQETYTTVTDEIGDFNFENLTAGKYTLSFEHEDYTMNGTHSFTLTEGLMFVFTDPFEFTKKSSTGGDDSGDTTDPNRTVTASGDCGENGDNVTWTLYDDGELVISGSGAMKNYGNYITSSSRFYREHITSVVIEYGVTSIGNYAFDGCGFFTITIPDSVTSIGDYAFSGCNKLTSITIPNSVTNIGDYAFSGCNKLTSITIPNSVTNIGDSAFSDCNKLTSIMIPNSVISIGDYAFYDCDSLTDITVDLENNYFSSDEYGVLFNKNKTELFKYPQGNTRTSYIIPDSVTIIGNSAFDGCTNLTSITIPNSVISIGDSAFRYCDSLTSITIPNSVISIGAYAFDWCTSITNMTIGNSVTSISNRAFAYCKSITSITIPNSVINIGDSAFDGCTNLTSITIPNSVISIGDSAFRYCDSLTSITIPDSVTSIGNYAFDDCDSLASVTIGDSVTSIGYKAFIYCDKLESIRIPNSITRIDDLAFCECNSLTDVYFSGTQNEWDTISIGLNNGCLINATIHYNT